MASRIEIARGSLSAFLENGQQLIPGELFWQAKNNSNNSETGFRENTGYPWDEGTLYIGHPHLREDANGHPIDEKPLPIAGTRAFKSLVFKGKLSEQLGINITADTIGDTFKYVRTGDFFIFENDAKGGEFKNVYDFRKNDILLVTNADFDIATGLSSNIQITKIDCSGGDAYQTRFDNTNNNFKATNVQDALDELEYEKLSYRGTLSSQVQVTGLQPEIGTLWLIVTDGLVFDYKKTENIPSRPTKKGDFAYYVNAETGWVIIPSGYTDSEDIDFDSTTAVASQRAANSNDTTFDDNHINATASLTTVKAALDFILANKAQLDSSGKVPLSQLHDTVLGNLQYCGIWNPLVLDNTEGVNNPNYQVDWPLGVDTDGSKEDGLPSAPHNGDYYIIQTSGTNIQYADKTSFDPNTGTYKRYIELNSGDWIVYSKSPISDASVDGSDTNKYHWSKIDNTDRITALNFVINGIHSTGEALETTNVHTEARIGTPTIAASDKLVLWEDGGTITVAGVRLVSQKLNEDGKATVLPRYTKNKNELENSTIYNYKDEDKGELTLFHSNVSVGDKAHTFETEVHGDISIFPHLSATTTGYKDTQIKFFQAVDETLTTDLRELDLRVNPNYFPGSVVYLPEYSSTIIGKLKGVDLISGRITKSTQNGYIDSTSIEEHMIRNTNHLTSESGNQYYSDEDVDSIEIHAPTLTVNNAEIRHITFGQEKVLYTNENGDNVAISGTDTRFVDGHLPTAEYKANLYANQNQIANIIVYLPSRSGTLITDTDFNDQIHGTEKRLSVFGPELVIDGKPRSTLIDSNIRQTANALFNTMMRTASVKSDSDKEYLETYKRAKLNDGTYEEEDSVVESDLVIGKLSKGEEGELHVEEARNLLVTGDEIFAHPNGNNVFIHSERIFESDSQYRNPYTEELNPLSDVHVDLPASSGVLLTSNSRIDGGIWQ